MFTGLIEEVGLLSKLIPIGPDQRELTVGCSSIAKQVHIGDSVAVDGVCLTVIRYDAQSVSFQVSGETIGKSLFSQKPMGAKINLELALKVGERLGGHFVQGHIDSIATLVQRQKVGGFFNLWFEFSKEISKYLIPKGSIALNGVSLTLAACEENRLMVALIPHSYANTNLEALQIHHKVHVETDLLGRYVERLLRSDGPASKVDEVFLKDHGFF